MKIVSVGESTIDRYLRQNCAFVGGITLNFAVQAKRSGAEHVSLVSCVGDGAGGKQIVDVLASEQIDVTHVAVCAGKSAECDIIIDEQANRLFPDSGYSVNILENLSVTPAIIKFIHQHDILVAHFYPPLVKQLLTLTTFTGKRVIDFGDWSHGRVKTHALPILDQVDLAFISGDQGTLTYAQNHLAHKPCQLIITLGAEGSVALDNGRAIRQPALPVTQIVDPTGCGDAFQAAFTVSYFRDHDLAHALVQGATQAQAVLQHYGAFSQERYPLRS